MTTITIYGPGCKKCNDLTDLTKQLIAELKLDCELKKVTDPLQMASEGVTATPALAIDGKVVVKGYVPTKAQLSEILQSSSIPSTGCCSDTAQSEPAAASSCGCACSTPAPTPAPAPAETASAGCGCGSGGCCSGKGGGSMVKQLILWVVLILVGFAVYKAIDNKKEAASAAATSAQPAISNGVEVVYYQFGPRCVTCKRMEQWINEIVQQDFAAQLKSGAVVLKSVKASEEDVKKYALSTKSLIIKTITDGTEKSAVNAEKIWEHCQNEAAFKAYVAEQINKQLSAS